MYSRNSWELRGKYMIQLYIGTCLANYETKENKIYDFATEEVKQNVIHDFSWFQKVSTGVKGTLRVYGNMAT